MEAVMQFRSGCEADGGSAFFVQRQLLEAKGVLQTLGKSILLVDDDDFVRNVVKDMLEEAGYRVFSMESGEKAISFFRVNHNLVDLLVSDVVMPKMDGREMYEHLKRLKPGLPVVFISGYPADILNQLQESENIKFLGKPMNQETLVKTIQDVLPYSG